MTNLLEIVRNRTQETMKESKVSFSTNETLVEILLDGLKTKKECIDLLTAKRIEIQVGEKSFTKMKPEAQIELIDKLQKTSKNGFETSVSKSNNNSAFHRDPKVAEYRLIRDANKFGVVKNEQ